MLANEPIGPYGLVRARAWRARAGHARAVLHARGARARAAAPVQPVPRPAASSRSSSTRSGPARAPSPGSSTGTRSGSRGRSETGFDLSVAQPLLVGGGIGIAPFPYLSERLGGPPALLGFRTEHHAEAAALVPNAEVVLDPTLVTDALPDDPGDVLACGPEPMLDAIELRLPGAQLAREAPMACGYGACYGCVVPRNGYVRLCIDGPVLLAGDARAERPHEASRSSTRPVAWIR